MKGWLFYAKYTATIALFTGGLLLLFLAIKAPLNFYDEGLVLTSAARLVDGEVPYRNFWTIYAPGQAYVLAAVFRLFETSIIVARVYDTIVRFLLVLAIFLLSRRLVSAKIAWLPFAIAVLWLGSVGFYTYPVFPSVLFVLFGVLSLCRYMDTGGRRWLVVSGILIGVAGVFRLDIGAYAALSALVTLLVFELFRNTQGKSLLSRKLFSAARSTILLVAGIVAVILPFYGYLSAAAGFANWWTQMIVFTTTTFHEVRRLPYPPLMPDLSSFSSNGLLSEQTRNIYLHWLQFYLPIAIYTLSAIVIAGQLLERARSASELCTRVAANLALTIFGSLLFIQALSRYDWIHVLPSSLIALMVFTFLLFRLPRTFWKNPLSAAAIGAVLLVVLLSYTQPQIHRLRQLVGTYWPLGCYSQLERAGCVPVDSGQELAVQYLQLQTDETEPLFVGNHRHDLIFVNDVSFYFLAARPVATRYHELHPGVANTLPVQREIAQDLESNQVRWIVLADMPESTEPNASALSSGVTYLDEFIRDNYRFQIRFGNYAIWRYTGS